MKVSQRMRDGHEIPIPDPLLKMAIISDQSIPWRTRVIIVLNAKFDTYPMRKTLPAQENAGLVADDLSID